MHNRRNKMMDGVRNTQLCDWRFEPPYITCNTEAMLSSNSSNSEANASELLELLENLAESYLLY